MAFTTIVRAAVPDLLKPPFDEAKQRAIWGRVLPPLASCPLPPPAVKDLTHVIFYSDRAQSVVDSEKLKQNMENSKGIRNFAIALNRMADEYLVSSPPDPARAACVVKWLSSWAQDGALLGNVEFWARFDTIWFGAIPTNFAYQKVKNDPSLDASERMKVERWLANVARAGIAGEQARESQPGATKVGNILYWVGAAAILAGVSSNDKALFNYGIEAGRRGLSTVTPDGLLPAELERKGRAFSYMTWAAEPMSLIAATAKANNVDLAGENNGALARFFGFFMRAKDDPGMLERITGTRQDFDPAKWPKGGGDITFVETYLSIAKNAELESLAQRMRPVINPMFAGNYTQLFSQRHVP
jgi:poly(beta-D-mannuronate) lyase